MTAIVVIRSAQFSEMKRLRKGWGLIKLKKIGKKEESQTTLKPIELIEEPTQPLMIRIVK